MKNKKKHNFDQILKLKRIQNVFKNKQQKKTTTTTKQNKKQTTNKQLTMSY